MVGNFNCAPAPRWACSGMADYRKDSNQYYNEDILVGYRWFDTKKITPQYQYAFGYGLSYTSFDLGVLSADKSTYSKADVIRVKFTVKNTE